MYETPAAIITESAALEKKGAKTDSSLMQELTHKLGTTGPRAKDSMEKHGMSADILLLLSVAPAGTLRTSILEVQGKYFIRVITAINPRRMLSNVLSFSIGDGGRDLRYFRNFHESYGHSLVLVHGRKYMDMRDSSEDSGRMANLSVLT